MNTHRNFSPIDNFLINLDQGVKTLFGSPTPTERCDPSEKIKDTELSSTDKKLAGRLLRINHAGEVAAQGLYQGQALTAKKPDIRETLHRSALEENDHLIWCQKRIKDLASHKSVFNPLWYLGSVTIGVIAGIAGDKWSLGFVAETEHQVVKHIDNQLGQLPLQDRKSRAILEQMRIDEGKHASVAKQAGGTELPYPVKKTMELVSRIMVKTSYWV